METLPDEALIHILYTLLPINMSTINKKFATLYNDYFYKSYLELKYPCIIFPNNNYKDLYLKSLQEGDILKIDMKDRTNISELKIQGFKVVPYHNHVLRFNGDLYSKINNEYQLIDTNVIDIDDNFYIKENQVYNIIANEDNSYTIKSLLIFPQSLQYITFFHSLILVTTSNSVYQLLESGIIYKSFDINIKKVRFCKGAPFLILLENGELHTYLDTYFVGHGIINNVQDIEYNMIKIDGIWHLIYHNYGGIYKQKKNIFHDVYDMERVNLVSYPLWGLTNVKSVVMSEFGDIFPVILSNNKIYKVEFPVESSEPQLVEFIQVNTQTVLSGTRENCYLIKA